MDPDEDLRTRLGRTPSHVPTLEPRAQDVFARVTRRRGRRRVAVVITSIIALLGVGLPLASLAGLHSAPQQPGTSPSSPPALQAIVAQRVDVGASAGSVAAADGSVWVTTYDSDKGTAAVVRIVAETNQIVATIPIDGFAYVIAVGDGAVWVPADKPHGGADLLRIDERTNEVTGTVPDVHEPVVVDPTGVWAVQGTDVVRIDPDSLAIQARIPLTASAFDMAAGGGWIWVQELRSDKPTSPLVQIDAATATVTRTLDVSGAGIWIAAEQEGVYVNGWRPDGSVVDFFVPASGGPPEEAGSVYNFRPFAVALDRVWFISGPTDRGLPKGGICGLNISTRKVDVCAQPRSIVDLEAAHDPAAFEPVTDTVWVGEYQSPFVTRIDVVPEAQSPSPSAASAAASVVSQSPGTQCVQATTSGDFDGDGTLDEANLVAVVPADVSCERNGDVYMQMESQRVEIEFGSGLTLDQTLTDCQPCLTGIGVFTATDLDGDGRDELAIDVGPGAATDYVQLYRVDPVGIGSIVVSEPGDPPYVEPGPAILGGGFDSGQWSPIQCRVAADGTRELVSVHAENLTGPITGPWKVHTTTMTLEGDRLVVTSMDDVKSEKYTRGPAFQNGCF